MTCDTLIYMRGDDSACDTDMCVRHLCLLLLPTLGTVCAVSVTGLVGSQVTLPCNMTKDSLEAGHRSKYPATSVRWQKKDGKQRTVVSVLSSGLTFTAQSMISRVVIQQSEMDQGVFSLHLKDVQEEDAGIYHGKAQYGDSKQNCLVILHTIKLTQSPRGLLPERTSVNLTCSSVVDPEQTSPSVRWFHRGVLVQPSSRVSLSGFGLYILSLTQDDQGEWSCEEDGVRSSLMLRVLGISGPSSLSVYTASGSSAELPCNVNEMPMEWPLRVRWSRATGPIGEDKQMLLLNHVRAEDAGTYRCDVTFRSQQLTRHINLRVIQVFPPGPTFAKEGSSHQLLCNVSGLPGEERFEWTGPSDPTGQHKVLSGAVLDLPIVHAKDSGTWICSVYGKDGTLGKVEHWIYVHAPHTAGVTSFSSWRYILPLSLLLVFGLIAIAVVSFRNRQRRLSHLAALTSMGSPPASHPKKISV
ncbi:lymphocyte activation gene 3 protein [Pseudophryne corroboree]|uniref:lymphocyte activation gene 3 protein n=1 Tax=Pseudophryne corroboree TaxID=495146 RepID=UPI003081DBD8